MTKEQITVYLASGRNLYFRKPKDFTIGDLVLHVEDGEGKNYIFPFTSIMYWTMEEMADEKPNADTL